jgi:tripartite-type tricarboxylate transporter receptor subunit TctC
MSALSCQKPRSTTTLRRVAALGSILGGVISAAISTSLLVPSAAGAQEYPTKPVRLLIGAAQGGPQDALLRGTALLLTQALGQTFVVENRVGADGIIAGEACARATPDGYTLCSNDNWAISLNPLLHLKMPYDPLRDLVPVVHFGYLSAAIVASPSLQVRSMAELLELARAKPGAVSWGSYGTSSASNLYIEWLRKSRGIDFLNVPYKSAALAYTAMLGGEVQVSYIAAGIGASALRAGKFVGVAMVGPDTRSTLMPDVPTWKEAGLDFNIGTWFGLFAPAGTPRAIIERLNATVARELINNPPARERYLAAFGVAAEAPAGASPEAFAALIQRENEKLAGLVRTIGLKPE